MGLGADILLKIRSTLDSKAIDEATKKTQDLGVKAAEVTTASAEKSAGAFTKIGEAVKSVSSRMEIVNKLMSGLGITGIIGSVIAAAARLKQRFEEIAEAARKVKLDKISADNEKAVKGLTDEYAALLKMIDAVNQATLRQRELEAARIKNKRDMEDVRADMDQQDELDKLDRDDPLYSEKAGEVRARFKSMAVERQSGREAEDIQIKATQAGDKIRDLRKQEEAARLQAEKRMDELLRQQKTIEDLEKPVMVRTKGGLNVGGSGLSNYSEPMDVQDLKATKQNQEAAKKLRKKLPDLAKSATEDIAKADDIQNQIVQAAQIASAIFDALRVAQQKATLATRQTSTERAEAYRSTDTAAKDFSDKSARKYFETQAESKNKEQEAAEERFKPLIERTKAREEIVKREMEQQRGVVESYRSKGDMKGANRETPELIRLMGEYDQVRAERDNAVKMLADRVKGYTDDQKYFAEQMKRIGQ